MTRKEDVSRDLKPSRIIKNSSDLTKIMSTIEDSLNPFSTTLRNEFMFNIGSGKAASPETTKFLLNVSSMGFMAQKKFIQECIEDPKRFEESIPREKLKTFATEGKTYKVGGKDKQLVAVRMERDLFGSILFLALQRKIDMGEVLKYPLTPVPLSLCDIDGSMLSTCKAALLKELEKRVKTVAPNSIDSIIVDGMFFLHLLADLPSTFGLVAKFIFQRICSMKADRIDMVFDKTITPSIKDCERDKRCEEVDRNAMYEITGPTQKRPVNFKKALRNNLFKQSLVKFLVISWEDDTLAEVLKHKEVFVNCEDTCYSFKASDGKMSKTEELHLHSTHEEAGSKMIFHLHSLPASSNVVIRTVDTDVLIILLGNMEKLDDVNKNVWLEVGLFTMNTLRYIDVRAIYNKLGCGLCKSLPAFHSFTGCDYTAALNRKGKLRPLRLLEKDVEIHKVFAGMGNSEAVTETQVNENERFTCSLYGRKKLVSVDYVRLDLFFQKYKPKPGKVVISCVKKMDGSSLPPLLVEECYWKRLNAQTTYPVFG